MPTASSATSTNQPNAQPWGIIVPSRKDRYYSLTSLGRVTQFGGEAGGEPAAPEPRPSRKEPFVSDDELDREQPHAAGLQIPEPAGILEPGRLSTERAFTPSDWPPHGGGRFRVVSLHPPSARAESRAAIRADYGSTCGCTLSTGNTRRTPRACHHPPEDITEASCSSVTAAAARSGDQPWDLRRWT